MIKKTIVILIFGIASTVSMDSTMRLEYMRNGAALSATMTQQQKIEFMRNGRQIAQQLSQQVLPKEIPQEIPQETKPAQPEKPLDQENNFFPESTLDEDEKWIEDDILNHVIKLSLDDNQPIISEATQTVDNANGKNVIINYNVTIKQKLNYSSQNINIGNKKNNQ